MPTLTKDQALQIAKALSGFANIVEDYRFAHYAGLTDLQMKSLRNVENMLRASSDSILDLGVKWSLDDVQGALDGLNDITARLKLDIGTLTDINKAIQVGGVLVQLGTALATGNPAGILSALEAASAVV